MSPGLYVHRESAVHAAPAGPKMLGLATAATLLLLCSSATVLLLALAATLALYALARLGPRELAFLRPLALWGLLPLFVLQGVLSDWDTAARAVLRLTVLLLLAMLVSLTTRASAQLAALQRALGPLARVGVSPARLGLLLSLTLRFIPLMATWLHEVREAQRVRGLEHHPLAVLVPLLVKTLRTADALAEAIDARCFDAEDLP